MSNDLDYLNNFFDPSKLIGLIFVRNWYNRFILFKTLDLLFCIFLCGKSNFHNIAINLNHFKKRYQLVTLQVYPCYTFFLWHIKNWSRFKQEICAKSSHAYQSVKVSVNTDQSIRYFAPIFQTVTTFTEYISQE